VTWQTRRIQNEIARFLEWWAAELAFLVPSRVKRWFGANRPVLILSREGDAVRAALWDRESEWDLGLFRLDGEGARAREELWRERPALQNAEVLLNLTPAESLVRRFRLPEATEVNLEQVAGFELDRLTPFRSEQVYYHARLIERAPETKQIVVELALTPKSVLDPLLEELAACGWLPDRVEIGANPDRRAPQQLLPERFRKTRGRVPQTINLALGSLALVLLLLIVVLPIWRDYRRTTVLEQELRRVSKEAKEVEALRQDVEKLAREARFVLDKKRSEPALVDVFNELSRVIPDNTWLYGLQYKDRRVIMQGQSPSASSLIAVIESSPYFRNTNFVSPVTKDVSSGLERFQIASEVINGRLAENRPEKPE